MRPTLPVHRNSVRLRPRFALLAAALAAFASAIGALAAPAQFYFGNDLSYVNQLEDCGAVYREGGVAKDPFRILADHGTNLVRVRLWNDPWWQPLVPQTAPNAKPQYNDLADVIETIRRAKGAGMQVMLDFHFSDFWADPGRQVMPRAWSAFAADDAALETRVHDYVRDTLTTLDALGLMPEIVKLGNESNAGILLRQTLTASWNAATQQLDYAVGGLSRTDNAHVARMWNAGIRAVREVGAGASVNPRIALHCAGLAQLGSFYDWVLSIGVTDFDIMGFSYYYAWHGGSIAAMGTAIRQLKTKHPGYDVMVAETGYPWDSANIDALGNIIGETDPAFRPASPQKQRDYMVAYTQEVIDAGGIGVVFWEPCWVSTIHRTPWGVGSSQEHVAYFDHRDGNNFHLGGTWTEATYAGLPARPAIVTAPVGASVAAGAPFTLTVGATGSGLSYQWFKDGVALRGPTAASLHVASADVGDVGRYAVRVRNTGGSATSAPVAVAVAAPNENVMAALSTRGGTRPGGDVMIMGVALSRPAKVLIRGIGPTLRGYGLSTASRATSLELVRIGSPNVTLATNAGWDAGADATEIADAAQTVGGFALAPGTQDSALLIELPPGLYTATVRPAGELAANSGIVLCEKYLVAAEDNRNAFAALSTRGRVDPGEGALVMGIVVNVRGQFLIRGSGPALAGFGVGGAAAAVSVELVKLGSPNVTLATNDGWGANANVAAVQAAGAAVGAFAWADGSRDSALLVWLDPGVYTAAVRPSGDSAANAGVALVESYLVP